MKKLYLERTAKILIFLVLFVYLFIHFTYCFRDALSHTREHLMGFYSEKKNTVDVVALGTSSTFSSIVPMEMWNKEGIAAYDYCTNVMFEDTMPYALREIVKTQSPKLILIDITPFMLGHNSKNAKDDTQQLRYNVDGMKISKNRFDLVNHIVPNYKDRLYYYFDFLFYHSNSAPAISNWNYSKASANKGYSNLQIEVSYTEEDLLEPDMTPYELEGEEINNLNALFAEIDKLKLDVLFIVQPYQITKKSVDKDRKARAIQKYIEDNGYKFLNMHEHLDEIGIDIAMDNAVDYSHFNIDGALKISDFLATYLKANYDIPDRREDAAYDKWRSEYEEWENKLLPDNHTWTNTLREMYFENKKEKLSENGDK